MLPNKIKKLLISLRDKTNNFDYETNANGDFEWDYNYENSMVFLETISFHLSISYDFDTVEEVGRFNIAYSDKNNGKKYFFSTDQRYNDYDLVKSVYDTAQSSDLDIDFDF